MSKWASSVAVVLMVITWPLAGQDKSPGQTQAEPERAYVMRLGPEITPPEPFPLVQPSVTEGCHHKVAGKIRLAEVVDTEGHPRNLYLTEALGNDLDRLALVIMDHERFKPGMLNSVPVAVGVAIYLELNGCVVDKKDAGGKKSHVLRLRSMSTPKLIPLNGLPAEVTFGPTVEENESKDFAALKPAPGEHREPQPDVIQPKLFKFVEAQFSDEAREKKVSGTNVVTLVVDSNGMPRHLEVARRLGAGLDEMAMAAVQSYRFLPATKYGQPIAVPIAVEVKFRFY